MKENKGEKIMKKFISVLLVLVLALTALSLVACEKKKETYVMATNAAFPPYEYKDGNKFAGIDIEIAQAIADKLGMKLEIADVDFGAIIGGVQSGKYDFGMAGMTVNEDRKKSVDFSNTYATGIQVIIVKEDSQFNSLEDFFELNENGDFVATKSDVKIGVQQDTTGDIYSSASLEEGGFGEDHVIRYKTGADAVQALVAGKVSAVIIDNEPAKSFVAANSGLKILDAPYAEEEYAICVAKNNKELLDKINKALEELTADGTIQSIIDKYINPGSSN